MSDQDRNHRTDAEALSLLIRKADLSQPYRGMVEESFITVMLHGSAHARAEMHRILLHNENLKLEAKVAAMREGVSR